MLVHLLLWVFLYTSFCHFRIDNFEADVAWLGLESSKWLHFLFSYSDYLNSWWFTRAICGDLCVLVQRCPTSTAFNPGFAGSFNCKTMSRRPSASRRFGESGSLPFVGALHSKSHPSPLVSIGLFVVVNLPLFCFTFSCKCEYKHLWVSGWMHTSFTDIAHTHLTCFCLLLKIILLSPS